MLFIHYLQSSFLLSSFITSFVLPVGEHLLKVVEQLEIVTSAVHEAFATIKTDNLLHDVLVEMEKYGSQQEKEILSQCNLVLKKGVVRDTIDVFISVSIFLVSIIV